MALFYSMLTLKTDRSFYDGEPEIEIIQAVYILAVAAIQLCALYACIGARWVQSPPAHGCNYILGPGVL